MRLPVRGRLARLFGWIAAGVAGLGLLVLLVAWSGVYSVAASRGHWELMEWFLTFGMHNSVERHAQGIRVPPLDDPDMIRLGARHYAAACADCHGAPGDAASRIARRLLPPPPDLIDAKREWHDRELFWITRNGLKYTGMPAWPALRREDDVWPVIAFLRTLPRLDAAGYRDLMATSPTVPEAVRVCARCHGTEGQGPDSALVPVLHGQSAPFLAASLEAYYRGWRESGIMQWVVSSLSPETFGDLAAYYAALPPPRKTASSPSDAGRALAEHGAPDAGIPPCLSCHGATALPLYPRLAGQNQRYMMGQLGLWRGGIVAATDTAALMAPIARRLSDRQIEAVSAYFAQAEPR